MENNKTWSSKTLKKNLFSFDSVFELLVTQFLEFSELPLSPPQSHFLYDNQIFLVPPVTNQWPPLKTWQTIRTLPFELSIFKKTD